uniref:HAT C-terminal dimerisation domain-containing protein n=1 Tax=Megaselia scalaris TaxID=36166 RepID=T1GU28_MEGSC
QNALRQTKLSFSSNTTIAVPVPEQSSRQKQISNALALFLASEPKVSAEMLTREPFQHLANVLFDGKMLKAAPIQSANTLRKKMMDTFEDIKVKAIQYIKEKAPKVIAVIFDLWTDSSSFSRNFLGIQLQFSLNLEITNINIGTFIMEGPKTGMAIAEIIFKTLQDFGITDRFIFFVTDDGSNCMSAVSILLSQFGIKGERLPCLAHQLHNLVTSVILKKKNVDAVSDVTNVIEKLSKIKTALRWRTQEIVEKDKNLRLIKALSVTLNGSEEDEEALEELLNSQSVSSKVAVNDVLVGKNLDLLISRSDDIVLSDLSIILSPINDFVTKIQSKTNGTLRQVMNGYKKLKDSFQNNDDIGTEAGKMLQLQFGMKLNDRFNIVALYQASQAVEPGMLGWDISLNEGRVLIKNYAKTFEIFSEDIFEEQVTNESAPKSNEDSERISRLKERFALDLVNEKSSKLDIEITAFANLSASEALLNYVEFWEQNKSKFKIIYKLFDLLYGIPATSSSIESAFSVAGNVVNKSNGNLSDEKVAAKCFVKINYQFLQKIGAIPSVKFHNSRKRRAMNRVKTTNKKSIENREMARKDDFVFKSEDFQNVKSFNSLISQHKDDIFERFSIKTQNSINSTKYLSKIWNYFGYLYVTDEEGNSRHVLTKRNFCMECLNDLKNNNGNIFAK